jgi:nucleoside-diphosphate-sugar epimerase
MSETVLVTGGTGTLEPQLVPQLRAAEYRVRLLSRHAGDLRGDLLAGSGLAEAVAGAEIVEHLASGAAMSLKRIKWARAIRQP